MAMAMTNDNGQRQNAPGIFEFLFLLLDASVDLLAHLRQFQLAAQHLVLLLFQGGLSLLQGGLQLVLLDLQALPGLLDLVDVAATLADLVQQVLDFICKLRHDYYNMYLVNFVSLSHSMVDKAVYIDVGIKKSINIHYFS